MSFLIGIPTRIEGSEFRGLWVDSWHDGFLSEAQVSKLVSEVRRANLNAIFVQVRKRGDAYYNSPFEPKATNIVDSAFDPLAELTSQAHNTNVGPRIEVHAWLVTYPVSTERTPENPQHPYNLHRDWLCHASSGDVFDGVNYYFDPGHPKVQSYLADMVLDLVKRYDVDGVQFDYIHYQTPAWGYHPVAVERFNRLHHRSGKPAKNDPEWMQFRRDQVTDLVRKCYLSIIATKPNVKVSVTPIAQHPSIANDAEWRQTKNYAYLLQDSFSWAKEGLVDMVVPMTFYRQEVPTYVADFARWNDFFKDHQFNRHVVMGVSFFNNTVSNSIEQVKVTRKPSKLGNMAQGFCGFSYVSCSRDSVTNEVFLPALSHANQFSDGAPLLEHPVDVPEMPWKTHPTKGYLKGTVSVSSSANIIDGAVIDLDGPTKKTMRSDGTGFYGAAELLPGNYTLVTANAGYHLRTNQITIVAGKVTSQDVLLEAK